MLLLQLQFQIMAPPVMQNSPYPKKSFLALPSYSLIAQDNTVMQESKKHHQPILESISKGEKPSLMFFFNEPLVLVPVAQSMLKQVLYPARLWLAEADLLNSFTSKIMFLNSANRINANIYVKHSFIQ